MSIQESRPEGLQLPHYLHDATKAVALVLNHPKKYDSCAVFGAHDPEAVDQLSKDISLAATLYYDRAVATFEYKPNTQEAGDDVSSIKNFNIVSKSLGFLIVKNLDEILIPGKQQYESTRLRTVNCINNLVNKDSKDTHEPSIKVCAITRSPHEELLREQIGVNDRLSHDLLRNIDAKYELTGNINSDAARRILLGKGVYDEETVQLPLKELEDAGMLTQINVSSHISDKAVADMLKYMSA